MKLFADRGFITINGYEAMHIKSIRLGRNRNLGRVDTMTRNRRSAGFKLGNLHVTVSFEMDIEAERAQLDLAMIDPKIDVGAVFELGGERHTIKGLMESNTEMNGSVGDGGKSVTCEALDIVNENGTSVIADLEL